MPQIIIINWGLLFVILNLFLITLVATFNSFKQNRNISSISSITVVPLTW